MTTALVIHGHFYQPPRENPWTDHVDREPSAHPFHDWNQRINAECYRPNAFARILDGHGRLERIVNNYRRISFNYGPTLMSWLEQADPAAYARILQADRDSTGLYGGHGNAIAQGYNHAILPLCNERDLRTQIRWGLSDFRHRFGRDPESLWCAETAVNDKVLGALIDEGMRYAILSPYQAERVRASGGKEWRGVADGSIDPGVAYRYFHRDGSGRSLALFFYDGPVARSIAFEGVLNTSQAFLARLRMAGLGHGRIVHIATDGESYGHHTKFGDRALAHAMESLVSANGFEVSNYGQYLEHHPPEIEVEIKAGPNGEGTAWSCAHGVGRWTRDCGCETGAQPGWNQAWRRPLRAALDALRDEAAEVFQAQGAELFHDPWAARDDYISVVLDRRNAREPFLRKHYKGALGDENETRALTLLETQRQALLMYTSCGWFFNDISGIETVQVLKYAGRMLDFLDELDIPSPRSRFLGLLAEAHSNIPEMGNGSDIFRKFVDPCRVTPQSIAAHLGISSVINGTEEEGNVAGHRYSRSLYRKEERERLTLATCRVTLENELTGRGHDFALAAMHFGGIDFYCLIKPFPGTGRFKLASTRLWDDFGRASLPVILHHAEKEFGPEEYGLEHVLPQGRQRIAETVFSGIVNRFSDYIGKLYEDNQRSIGMLQSLGFELPRELNAAAEFTLGKRFTEEIRVQHQSHDPASYQKAIEIAEEVARHGFQIDNAEAGRIFERMIASMVDEVVLEGSDELAAAARDLIGLTKRMGIRPNLDRAQEILHTALPRLAPPISEPLRHLAVALGFAPEAVDLLLSKTPPKAAQPGQASPAAPPGPAADAKS
jgi:alpha-amylase/alpha-mannosidase (GH57 family)